MRRVVVVTLAATGDYVPYVRLSDGNGYVRLATRKYEGPKTFRDFRVMQRALSSHGFASAMHVYPEGHPMLARIGIDPEAFDPLEAKQARRLAR